MFENWYNDYLRMIYPRSPSEDFEFSFDHINADKEKIYKGAVESLRDFHSSLSRSEVGGDLEPAFTSIYSAINSLGALSAMSKENILSETDMTRFDDLVLDFEKLIQKEQDNICVRFITQTDNYIRYYISKYSELIKVDLEDQAPTEFYNPVEGKYYSFDGSTSYTQFLRDKGQVIYALGKEEVTPSGWGRGNWVRLLYRKKSLSLGSLL